MLTKCLITKLCNCSLRDDSFSLLSCSPSLFSFLLPLSGFLFLSPSPLPLQSEANKLRQRANLSSSAASAPLKTTTSGTPAAQPQSSLHIVAIMLILVALILGYLVGKWL